VYQYSVIESNAESAVVALRDQEGRCHLGRSAADAPASGAELLGEPPALGLRTLRLVGSDEPCPVVLVLLDCDPHAAAKLIRAKLSP
jgi:hypothetical protein